MSQMYKVKWDVQGWASDTNVAFRGLTVSEREDGWNCVIRGTDREGVAVYAMMTGEDPNEVMNELVKALLGQGGGYLWRLDKWAQKAK